MELVELVITTDDPEVAELCKLYWATDSEGGYLHTVKDLTERYGLKSGQVNQLVRSNSEAFTLNQRCPRCDAGFPVQSRSDLASSLRGASSACVRCQQELAAIQRRKEEALQAARRSAILAAFPVIEESPIVVEDLDLRLAMTIAGLLHNGESAGDGIVSPLSERFERLAPTHTLAVELTRSAFAEGLILIHPTSPLNAFEWKDGTQPDQFFIDRAAYYLAGSGSPSERMSRFHADFEAVVPYDNWPASWAAQFTEFWVEVAIAECASYLVFCLKQHGLDFNPGEQTIAAIRKGLGWFSIGQLFNFIWRAARDAAAYLSRERVPKHQAANSAVTRLRMNIERAYAEGWSVQPYKRDSRLPASTISHLLLTSVLRLTDPMGFNPLIDTSRSSTKLQWSKLDAEQFERLIFNLATDAEGYADVNWLMKTNAPDHGRDVGAVRLRNDTLSGYTQERIVIQCKHWLSRSIKDEDISKEITSVSHWDNPPVDVLVIATSGRFTADAVSWAERHNSRGVRPRVEMWNDAKLEKLLAERPHLVLSFELR